MPVWISYVQSAIYTQPPGYFFKVYHFLSFSFLSEMSNSYLGLICLLVQQSLVFIPLILPSLFCFWERFPVGLIIKTFQQIAGENITPKVVASRGKITMLFISMQISLQHCSCHLLTIRLIFCGANAMQAFPLCSTVSNDINCKQTRCQFFHSGSKNTGYFGEL